VLLTNAGARQGLWVDRGASRAQLPITAAGLIEQDDLVRWGRPLALALGIALIAVAIWLALLSSATPDTTEDFGFHLNPCEDTILQAFKGTRGDLLDPTESRWCTYPARERLAWATGSLIVGVVLVSVGARLRRTVPAETRPQNVLNGPNTPPQS
jgi:hypothetical protein